MASDDERTPIASPQSAMSPDKVSQQLQAIREKLGDLTEQLDQVGSDRLLTKKQAAELLNVSERTVDTLIADKEIRSIKVRRCRRIPREALEEYIQRKFGESPY